MKKYIFIALLLLSIIPSVSLAVWWNPFSWGDDKTPVIETPPQYVPTSSTNEVSPAISTEPKIVEKIVEKPIIKTQTITVQDPALQAQIDALVAENNSLKTELSKGDAELQMCQNNLALAGAESKDCTNAKKEVVSLGQELVSSITAIHKEKNNLTQNVNPNWTQSQLASAEYALEVKEEDATILYNSKIKLAQSEVQLYCE